jgi:hypothetical protein
MAINYTTYAVAMLHGFWPAAARYFFILCCRLLAPPGEKRQQKDGIYHSAEGQKTPTA